MDDILNMELELELKVLRKEVEALKKQNKHYEKILVENDLGDEIGVETILTPEEEICVKGIDQILDLVKQGVADKNDIQNYDILHKNLRLIRNQSNNVPKTKKATKAELLSIVQGNKE